MIQEASQPGRLSVFDPTDDLSSRLERAFHDFETGSGWRLSLPAKVIVQQGILSIAMDAHGMGGPRSAAERSSLMDAVVGVLPGFLTYVREQAEASGTAGFGTERVIGGILVLQHVRWLGNYFGCSCWPV